MAASRAFVTMATGILLMSFVLAAAGSAGRDVHGGALANQPETKTSETATSLPQTGRRRAPVADRHTMDTDTPLDVTASHRRHLFKAEHTKKAVVANPHHPNKVHKQISHRTKTGYIQKVDLPGRKKTKKSRVSLRVIRRVIEALLDEPVNISHKSETPLELQKSNFHVFNKETDKDVSIFKTPEPKKEHKHLHREAKSGRIETANKTTLANEPKLMPKKPDHAVIREFVAGEKKLARGKWRVVSFEERPLCKPHDPTMTTTPSVSEPQSKFQRIVDSFHKTDASGLRDLLLFSGSANSSPSIHKQKKLNQKNEANRLLDSFPGPQTNSNGFPDNWATNRFVLKKAHNAFPINRAKRCGKFTKNDAVDMLTVGSGTKKDVEEVADTNIDSVEDIQEAAANKRVKKSVGASMNPDNLTVEWNNFNEVYKVTEQNKDDNLLHCIPTQTFAVGLICMSVILSICFLLLWRKTDQPEKMYALAYIIACIVYVILALVYLGKKSAEYMQTAPVEE